MALFKRGYEAAREEKKRQEEVRENMGKRLFRFFLSGDGAEATVRFLTEEPVNFNEHTIKTVKNGSDRYETYVCTGDDKCPYCESGDRASFKGAYLVWDYTPYETTDDKGKKKKVNGSLKLYVAGTRVLSQLDRLSSRYGLTSRDYEISRTGTGTSTSYMIERTDEVSKLTAKQIENWLPEKLREEFDGSVDSLYKIVEDQLKMYIPSAGASNSDDDDDDDDNEEEYRGRKNLVSYDDDDEDEEEDERPKKSKSLKSGKTENSAKRSVKGLFKGKKKKSSDYEDILSDGDVPF